MTPERREINALTAEILEHARWADEHDPGKHPSPTRISRWVRALVETVGYEKALIGVRMCYEGIVHPAREFVLPGEQSLPALRGNL